LTATLFFAGCAGGYDQELLGDPEPVAVPAPVQQESAPIASRVDPGELAAEGFYATETPRDYEIFEDLDAYGEWYDSPEYGPVWQPSVVYGWQPFTRGQWIYTQYGWMWAPSEPFGWATAHYGYWWLDPVIGWIWIPGYEWSPCRADWFWDDGYIGWTPIAPPGYHWDDPWSTGNCEGWVIVDAGRFRDGDVGERRVPPSRFKEEYRVSALQRGAPDPERVEKVTQGPIRRKDIEVRQEVIGGREVRRVITSPNERGPQPITNPGPPVMGQPVNATPMPVVAPPTHNNGGGTGSSGKVRGERPSSGGSKEPQKAKGGGSKDGGSKDDGSKDDGKAKGGDSKDSGGGEKKKGKKG
jgi:hypothetical protein